ncbi:hypothetical protein [Roseivivax sediminis]|uniref:Uncharacterized protein n=1 Tax=Roseivivax sediminis TaxID=936889 RepID=A0A1I2CN95_9RHOB|nr:hypothetical protein [Roseivivax sediminis]SFE69592.1 hypothetical protein SAMN04515678_1149 [Roseivivax sediminis]
MTPEVQVAFAGIALALASVAMVKTMIWFDKREARLRKLEADLHALQAARPVDNTAAASTLVAAFGMGVALALQMRGGAAPKASGDRGGATNRPEARKGTSIDEHSVTVTTAATSGL